MAKARIKREFNVETGIMAFTELASSERLECDLNALYPGYADMTEIAKRGVGHFVNAKCGDSAADPTNPAIPQIRGTWDLLVGSAGDGSDGVWSSRGDGTGGTKQTDLAVAVFTVMSTQGDDVTQESVNEAVAGWDDDRKKSVRADPRVKREVEKIRTQRQVARDKASAKAAKAAAGDATPLTL